jgi:hypothetical protein
MCISLVSVVVHFRARKMPGGGHVHFFHYCIIIFGYHIGEMKLQGGNIIHAPTIDTNQPVGKALSQTWSLSFVVLRVPYLLAFSRKKACCHGIFKAVSTNENPWLGINRIMRALEIIHALYCNAMWTARMNVVNQNPTRIARR